MKIAFVIGRILVGFFYLSSGVNLFLHLPQSVGAAAARGVPDPSLAVPVAAAFLVIGGLSVLLGWKPELGIGAIALFLIPVTLFMHPFWREAGTEKLGDTINFMKNFALLGAALMFAAIPRPWIAGVESGATRRNEPIPLAPGREQRSARG